jgi:uncharacterized protein
LEYLDKPRVGRAERRIFVHSRVYLGILQFELLIHDAQSLKDKRRVVKSVKDRLHREHLVAVAEVGALEIWNVARMGLAAVSNDGKHLSDVLDNVLAKLRSLPAWNASAAGAELGDFSKQIIAASQLDSEADDDLWSPSERREDEKDG